MKSLIASFFIISVLAVFLPAFDDLKPADPVTNGPEITNKLMPDNPGSKDPEIENPLKPVDPMTEGPEITAPRNLVSSHGYVTYP